MELSEIVQERHIETGLATDCAIIISQFFAKRAKHFHSHYIWEVRKMHCLLHSHGLSMARRFHIYSLN